MPKDTVQSDTITFDVEGLSCAGCVRRAETAMAGVEGVDEAAVNLATAKATVKFHAPASARAIFEATAAAGYPAAKQDIVLDVEGATCASCVLRIENALEAVDGVEDAVMNLTTGQARIRAMADVQSEALGAAVAAAGYTVAARAVEGKKKDRHAEEAAKMRTSFWLALILTLPVFIVEMGGHLYPPLHHFVAQTIGMQTSRVLQFVLTTAVLVFPGRVFFAKGFPALMRRAPDMNSLVAMGAGAAWLFSTVSTFAPGLLPAGSAQVYFESAAVIVTLILLGRMLEARAKGRASEAIRKLIGLTPDTAVVIQDGKDVEINAADVTVGMALRLKPGERVTVDGVVTEGESYLDESMLTGEPVPVAKAQGTKVTAGTVNGQGALVYRATAVGRDTVLARIVAMVEEAQAAKLPIQAAVDRVTMWFVPVVMGVAVLTVVAWFLLGPSPALGHALVAGVAVLIMACPCAMGLATPTSIMVGTGRAAQLGVLFRRGDALQTMGDVKVVALDKTGTLTMGKPSMTDLELTGGQDRDEVLAVLAAVEAQSEHPIARAIAAAGERLEKPDVTGFKSVTGRGVRATVGEAPVLIGTDRFLTAEGVDMAPMAETYAQFASDGKTPMAAAIDGALVAVLAVSDPIKESARGTILELHAQGIKVAMLTGDNAATARAVAGELGIDEVRAELMPKDKADAIAGLQKAFGKVAFVGDGINDAPALAAADVGIAVGTGTDVALETADVALMSGDTDGITRAFTISKAVMSNIRQNLFWAFGYNVLLIPVAAGVFYPLFGWQLSPALAAGAMAMSSVFVVTNALRLRRLS